MKKLYPLLIISILIYWGCEEEIEEDTIPPTVSISSPVSGQTVNESVNINVTTQDNDEIERLQKQEAEKRGYRIIKHVHQLFVKPIKK